MLTAFDIEGILNGALNGPYMITIVQRIQGVLTPNPSLDEVQATARTRGLYIFGVFCAFALSILIVISALNGKWLVYPSGKWPVFPGVFLLFALVSLWQLMSSKRALNVYAVAIFAIAHIVGTFKNGLLAYPLFLVLIVTLRQLLPRYLAWRFFIPISLLTFAELFTLPEREMNLALHYWLSGVYVFVMLDVSLANPTSTRVERARAVFDRFSSVAALFELLLAMLQWLGWLQGSVPLNVGILLLLGGSLLLRERLSAKHFGLVMGAVLAIFHTYAVSIAGESVMPYLFVYIFLGAVHMRAKYYNLYLAVLCFNQLYFLLTQSQLPLHGADVAVNFGVLSLFFGTAMYLVQPMLSPGMFGAGQFTLMQWVFTSSNVASLLGRFAYLCLILHSLLGVLYWYALKQPDLQAYVLGWPGFFWLWMLWLMMAFITIMTVRRENELVRLSVLHDEAEQHNRAQHNMLSSINHDIRTPLNNLAVTLQGIRADTSLSPMHHEYLQIMQDSADRLGRLMGDMIDVSHIERGDIELQPESIYLPNFVAKLLVSHDQIAAENGVTLSCDTLHTPAIGVQVDPLRLSQVLSNILTNAIKFSPGGEVTLNVDLCSDGVVFRVADNGRGMDDETLNRVFRRFEQADNSMTREYQGLGLGLSICSELVALMGGELSAKSAIGQGSEFTVLLPLPIVDEVVGNTNARNQSHNTDLRHSRLLVVEDDFVSRIVIETALLEHVAELMVVSSAEQALDALSMKQFDGVLTDIAMPGMSGTELLQQMRLKGYRMPVIAVTGNALAEELSSYRAAGFDDVLAKPVDTTALLVTLNKLLCQRSQGEQ